MWTTVFLSISQVIFMVVVGDNENGVIVNSGKMKESLHTEKEFLKAWGKTNYWTLLLQRKES